MRAWAPVLTLVASTLVGEGIAMEHVPEGMHKAGVARVRLGAPLPRDLVPRDPEARYVAGYHADFQPHEGFRLDTPPVTAFLDQGPFQRASAKGVVDPSEAKGLAGKAARAARGGARVRMILVESADVKTSTGVGVGSNLEALRAAYPDLRVGPVPPTFGGDECVATTPSAPVFHFHFRTCRAAEDGEGVVRVLLFRE